MPRLRLVMFDFDGTLVDSQHGIAQAMAMAFAKAGRPAPAHAQVRRVVGLPLEAAIARLLPAVETPLAAELAAHYRDAFHGLRRSATYHEPLMDGARAALERLDHPEVLLGIATGKGQRALAASLERHQLVRHFVTLKTADDGPGKPHPGILLDAMSELGVEARDTLVVGDTTFDMKMAVNAGARALGVSWGYHEVQDLRAAGAERVLGSFRELTPDLVGLEREG